MMNLEFGLVYCVTGLEFCKATVLSILSMPATMPVLVLCDHPEPVKAALADRDNVMVIAPEIPEFDEFETEYQRSRYLKFVEAPAISPFRTSLYLDSDILCLAPWRFKPVRLTEECAVGMVFDRVTRTPELEQDPERVFTRLLVPGHFEQFEFNGGVIAWTDGEEANRFFGRCWAEYGVYRRAEQPSILRAVYLGLIPVESLSLQLNFPQHLLCEQSRAAHRPILLHCLGGQIKSGDFYTVAETLRPDLSQRFQAVSNFFD